jgi:beta-mannanase
MGSGCSSEGSVVGLDGYNDHKTFIKEAEYTRKQFDKRTGLIKEAETPLDKPVGDIFEAV